MNYDTWRTDNGQDDTDRKYEAYKDGLEIDRSNFLDWVYCLSPKCYRSVLRTVLGWLRVIGRISEGMENAEAYEPIDDDMGLFTDDQFEEMVDECVSIAFMNGEGN